MKTIRARASAKSLSVQWEELTASDFPAAVEKAKGVCLLPIGVFEKHGPHLPLGADVMACRAVKADTVTRRLQHDFYAQIHRRLEKGAARKRR